MTCVLNGFDTYVYSRSPKPNDKAALVESFGAKYISISECTPAQLAERVGNIDLVYEAVGVAKTSFDVMMHLGLNGVFVFTGIPAPEGHVQLEGNQLMRNLVLKNQVIIGTVNADKSAFQAAIRDLGEFKRRWPHALRRLSVSLPQMALVTGIGMRLWRSYVLTHGSADSWAWVGGTFLVGVSFLFLMTAIHLGNFTLRNWTWRAPLFAVLESGTEILEFMRKAVNDFQQTIVMVTHDPNAASYADRVLFLADGRIVDEMATPTSALVLERMKTLESGKG